jgi:hypothetical protein
MTDDAPQAPETLTGRCMCGAVHYTVAERPLADGLCHCHRGRPQSGSAFSTIIFVRRSAVTITGETKVFDHVGTSGLRVLRRYCPSCGSPLTTEPDLTPEPADGQGRDHRLQRVVPPGVGAVRRPAQALGQSSSRRQAI